MCVCVCVCVRACMRAYVRVVRVHACVLDVGLAVWLYIGCLVLFGFGFVGLLLLLASVSTSTVKLVLSV